MERAVLAGIIDHTLLAPTATADQVALLCQEAAELGVAAVCVSPSRLPLAAGILPATIAVCTVIGFPSGAHRSAVKAVEAARAVDGPADLAAARARAVAGVDALVAAVADHLRVVAGPA